MSGAGWRVHGWSYPVIWWIRRKPRSRFRQRVWDWVDYVQMGRALRHWGKLRRK